MGGGFVSSFVGFRSIRHRPSSTPSEFATDATRLEVRSKSSAVKVTFTTLASPPVPSFPPIVSVPPALAAVARSSAHAADAFSFRLGVLWFRTMESSVAERDSTASLRSSSKAKSATHLHACSFSSIATSASDASRQLMSALSPSRVPPSPAKSRARKLPASSFFSGSANAWMVMSAHFLASVRTSASLGSALGSEWTYLAVSTSARTLSLSRSAGLSSVDLASSRMTTAAAFTALTDSDAAPPSE